MSFSEEKMSAAKIRKAIANGNFVKMQRTTDANSHNLRQFHYVQIDDVKYSISPRTFNLIEKEFGFKSDYSRCNVQERFRRVDFFMEA